MSGRNYEAPPAPPKDAASRKDGRMRNLVESFDALALAGKRRPEVPAAAAPAPVARQVRDARPDQGSVGFGFVGGFRTPHTPPRAPEGGGTPRYERWIPPQLYAAGSPPLPKPPAMPIPQHPAMSQTMQRALDPHTPPRAHARPPYSPPTLAPPTPPRRPVSDPPAAQTSVTPQPPKLVPPATHRRAQSVPLSPTVNRSSSKGDSVSLQCKGITNVGNQCRKMIKVTSARADTGGDVFCHLHEKKMQEPSGFYDRKTGTTFIKFEDWIPTYLQPGTQASLRAEMQKARAESDVDGYIYTFEILDPPAEKKLVHLKVGRATNLNRRMDQWGKQCGSKEQVLRGFWPGGVLSNETTLMKGLVQPGPKGPWCHRLERLVHIELADLAANTPYLEVGYPNVAAPTKVTTAKADIKRCPDCNTAHKEIFSFERAPKGRYKGKEWESIVKPVIEKWGGFVEAYL